MNQNKFYKLDNFKIIINMLRERLLTKYDFDICQNETISKTKKIVYSVMIQIDNKYDINNMDFKDLDSMVLKQLILYYINVYNLDQMLLKKDLLSEKKAKKMNQKMSLNKNEDLIPEGAENQEDFLKKLKDLEDDRARITNSINQSSKNKIFENIDIDRETKINNDIQIIDPKKVHSNKTEYSVDSTNNVSDTIIKKNKDKILIKKYIDINSADRNWIQDKYRFKYSINFLTNDNDIQSRYKNIESIRVDKVIIPQDTVYGVFDNDKNSKQPYRPYLHSFTLNLPFVYLMIDEFSDVYDGTNDTIRRCFSKLIIDRVIDTMEWGRKYIVLKPASANGDEKIFFPSPLSTLNRLSISLMKPNGNLLNTSHDHYLISNISYNSDFPNYFKVTLQNYFDINEFNTNDLLIFKKYIMTQLHSTQNTTDIVIFNEWINRQDGHPVVDIGDKNENNYYNSVYIMAPYTFEPINGNNVLGNNLINVLNNYNSNTIPPPSGIIMNYSLQNSISFTMKTYSEDPSFINEWGAGLKQNKVF